MNVTEFAPDATSPIERIRSDMLRVVAIEGPAGIRAALPHVERVHAAPGTRESLRVDLARWLQAAREVLQGQAPVQRTTLRSTARVYLNGDEGALGGAYLRRRVLALLAVACRPGVER